MLLPITTVARPVDDVDLSDLTTAVRTGPAVWTDDGLDIPFDRDLTPDEVAAVVLRLTTVDAADEQARVMLTDYLNNAAPSAEETDAQVRLLTALAVKLMDGPRIVVP